MEIVKVCRICLIVDVEMYDLQSYPLSTYFEPLLSGNNLLTVANCPPHACYECAELIKKSYFLTQKYQKSQSLLYELLDTNGQVVISELEQLDREGLLLSSNLSLTSEPVVTIAIDSIITQPYFFKKNEYDDRKYLIPKAESDVMLIYNDEKSFQNDYEVEYLKEEELDEDLEEIHTGNEHTEEDSDNETKPSHQKQRKVKERPQKRKMGRKKSEYSGREPLWKKYTNIEDYVTIVKLSVKEQIEEVMKRKKSSNYINGTFQCQLCYKGFVDSDAWNHHIQKHSPSAGDLECQVCKFRFRLKRFLQRHTMNHDTKYICKACPYVSSTTTQAKQHQGWHDGLQYTCKHCGEKFTVFTSYMGHVRIKHPSDFICVICGYSFVSKFGLAMHKTMMHKDRQGKEESELKDGSYCKECDEEFMSKEAYKRHLVMSIKHTKTTDLINGCRTCGEQFNTEEELKKHRHDNQHTITMFRKKVYVKYPIKCEYCPEEMPNSRQHYIHYRKHHPEKDYPFNKKCICEVCEKTFKCKASLARHVRTHDDDGAHKCDQCDKTFATNFYLQLHERTHSELRPFRCVQCPKTFKLQGALSKHLENHVGHKPYECEVCGKLFPQSSLRSAHVLLVHNI